jgi:hypothetical protein
MITYFRILVNLSSNTVEQAITSDAPLYDFKMIGQLNDVDEEVLFEEWNGVMENASFLRGRDLLNILNPSVSANDLPPTISEEGVRTIGNYLIIERYTKARYTTDQYKPVVLDLSSVADENIKTSIQKDYVEATSSGERREATKTGTLNEVIARQKLEGRL